ncbi:MAG: cytochrome c family protein, partial [Deltaproteobacteria bacterium]|nr:cytochrome c family protein [Deltaproteobacteria bacterium]
MKKVLLPGLILTLLLFPPIRPTAGEEEDGKQAFMPKGGHPYSELESSDRCLSCHRKIHRQYQASAMARAQVLPWDQAEYFKLLLPHVRKNPAMKALENACIRCHAPAAYLAGDVPPPEKDRANPMADGVICDVCHTMTGFMGDQPYNGNYRIEPGMLKYGPRKDVESYHHESDYHPIQTSAEMCGTCHDETSFYGAWVKETYR